MQLNNQKALDDSLKLYLQGMVSSCTEETSYIKENEFNLLHKKYKLEAESHLSRNLEGAQSSSINPLNTSGMSYKDTLEKVGLHLNVAHRILL